MPRLKKLTDDYADPAEGDALVDNCVTSVATGRTMAEIAAGEDVWRSNRGGKKGGRAVTAKYGAGHFERIGRKGGQKVADLIERAKTLEEPIAPKEEPAASG